MNEYDEYICENEMILDNIDKTDYDYEQYF